MIWRALVDIPPEGVSHNPDILKRVLLRAGEAPPVMQCAITTFEAGQVASAHKHADMVELFFCHQGRGTLTLDGREHAIGPGCFFVVEAGESHELASASDAGMRLTVVAVRV